MVNRLEKGGLIVGHRRLAFHVTCCISLGAKIYIINRHSWNITRPFN